MKPDFISVIDWARPWLAPYRTRAACLVQAQDWLAEFNDLAAQLDIRNHQGLPIRFVPQADLPNRTAYEAFISATGRVPTRNNLHDFFNALAWVHYPRIKVALNALQAAELRRASRDTAGSRGKVRDAATIFDENAAILIASDPAIIASLRAHDWNSLMVGRRQSFGRDWKVHLFGHALIEKLIVPYKAITAHAWTLIAAPDFFQMSEDRQRAWVDAEVSRAIAAGLATSMFTPLPVLGLPYWWEEQNEAFYADRTVFRPPRNVRSSIT